jgi:hypothetical protein
MTTTEQQHRDIVRSRPMHGAPGLPEWRERWIAAMVEEVRRGALDPVTVERHIGPKHVVNDKHTSDQALEAVLNHEKVVSADARDENMRRLRTTLKAELMAREAGIDNPSIMPLSDHNRIKWGCSIWTDCSSCLELLTRNAVWKRRPIDPTPHEECAVCRNASFDTTSNMG